MSSERSHRRGIGGLSPSWLVLAGVSLTVLLFGLVVWEALTAYGSYKSIESDELALDRLDMELTRLDEGLSISAILATATGDTSWETRYDSIDPRLDSVITEAAAVLDTSQSGLELMQIRRAHARRVETEHSAMLLAREGDRETGLRLLSSPTYREFKSVYVQSIDKALQRLNDRQEYNEKLLRVKLRLIGVLTAGVAAIAWLSILGVLQVNFRRRRAAETVLRESEERYRSVTEIAFDDIVLSENGALIDVSDKFARMFGYDRGELRGKPAAELVIPEDREFVRLAHSVGYDRPYETVCVRKDGTRFPVEMCGRKVPYHGRIARVTAIRDISERKQAESEREALIRDLKQKNEELERFTYTVSHDLKSPLITIKGFMKWVERDAEQGNVERMRANISRICGAADKMEHLMNSLLELSKNGHRPVKRDAILFENLAREALELVSGRAAQRGVKVAITPDLPLIYGDRDRLLEVVLNLLDNAIKFMGDQPKPRIEIGVRHAEKEPVFYVRDNGVGIAPSDQQRVLGLFEKLDEKAEGSGVGLALVKRIVEQHGGTLWIESEGEGKGSTFCFRLATFPVGQAA